MSERRTGEDDLIERYFAPMAGEGGLGLKDDAALLSPRPGHDLVLTADAVVAGVHFLADDPPASIARKALAVNMSDLAAKGASPVGFLLTLALPENWTPAWLDEFSRSLAQASRDFGCRLLGGDTVRTPGALSIAITALGEVAAGRMVRRTTARPGDLICVTGTIGDAALGLALHAEAERPWWSSLDDEDIGFLIDRYRHPQPRLALAALLQEYASAGMDVSDGLAGDLAKMMRTSGATAIVDAAQIPLSSAARLALAADRSLFDRMVTGGDDFELLVTVPPPRLDRLLAAAASAGVAMTVIGSVTEGEGLPVFRDGASERRYERGSFSHF